VFHVENDLRDFSANSHLAVFSKKEKIRDATGNTDFDG
jgi:hypothetical protein